MGFRMNDALQAVKKPDLLTKTPWLWVMSAGNAGVDLSEEKFECFADVPAEKRKRENILCVGALKRGIITDRIASYSNHGELIDVYAYETYTELCPAGTSCSTPAISAAAAVLKSKFPALTSAQIRASIVEAADSRTLEVEDEMASMFGMPLEKRTVKVFDPASGQMMNRAEEIAKKKLMDGIL